MRRLADQIGDHDPGDDTYVARKILDRVARESMAELGVGDLAKRRDEAWSATALVGAVEESIPAEDAAGWEEVKAELNDLLQRAIEAGKLSPANRDPLLDLAYAAERIDAPGRRGVVG